MYAADFLTDTSHWEADEVGVYVRLLLTQWVNGHLPAEMSRLARISGVSVDALVKIWLVIGCKFVDDGNGNLINLRMEKSRTEKEDYLRLQSEKGKKSAAARKNKAKINRGSNSVQTEGITESQPLEDEVEDEIENKVEEENHFEKSEKLFAAEAKNEPPDVTLPFDSEDFVRHWDWWRQYKREQFGFRYKSAVTEQAAVNELVKIAKGDETLAVEIIRQSIANGWKGFFPIKPEANAPPGNATGKKGVFQANMEANIGAKKLLREMYENGAFDHYKQR